MQGVGLRSGHCRHGVKVLPLGEGTAGVHVLDVHLGCGECARRKVTTGRPRACPVLPCLRIGLQARCKRGTNSKEASERPWRKAQRQDDGFCGR